MCIPVEDCLIMDAEATRRRIGDMMDNSGLSDKRIAEIMNLSVQCVNKWRNRKSIPDVENLFELSKILGVTVDEMLVSKADSVIPWKYMTESKRKQLKELQKRVVACYCNSKGEFHPGFNNTRR